MPEGSSQHQPHEGIQPPNQDIYGQNERPDAVKRRRRHWFSRKPMLLDKPSPAAAVSVGVDTRGDTPMRVEERRRRRRRRHGHSPELDLINRLTWIAVTVVTLLYLGLLTAVVLWQRTHPKVQKVEAPAVTKPESTQKARLSSTNDPARPVGELIDVWKRGLRALDDLHKLKTKQHPADTADALEKVLADIPNFTQARLELALALEGQNQFAEARDQLLEVLNHNPESLDAQQALGRVYLALNQPNQALELARWMVDNDPYSTPAHELAAEALLKQGITVDAIVHLKKLASLNRDNLTLQNNLGAAYVKVGDYRSALQTFREVLRMDEGNSVAHFNMAVAYAQQNQASNSVDVLTQAARRFGHPFVITWTRGAEFDPVRDDPMFVQFIGHPEALTEEAASTNAP